MSIKDKPLLNYFVNPQCQDFTDIKGSKYMLVWTFFTRNMTKAGVSSIKLMTS